ncbi:MAG: hypothetical protein A2172_04605 [Candidatus Woykebacteria bacterium RBG_13_40_15]|uniref:Uncharacterized protein n=1 Tax=Candidatus Woykebacteria bacterium RBG_13_40_15 TaxID=1802593 RepID=A0A1G1W7C3_9BACT|nr:MAG: hypothetical protein A2172_04605 [Candidatus Woykebacteria bacterium RBG_13_40_15]
MLLTIAINSCNLTLLVFFGLVALLGLGLAFGPRLKAFFEKARKGTRYLGVILVAGVLVFGGYQLVTNTRVEACGKAEATTTTLGSLPTLCSFGPFGK